MDDLAPSRRRNTGFRRPICAVGRILLLISLMSTGCLSVDRHVSCGGGECIAETAHVEVLRGISGYWPGAARFQEQLACRGVASTVSWCELYPVVADRIVDWKRQNPHLPVVVVGYSLGANDALKLARRLQHEGIMVDALVLLETTYVDTVPANVRHCFNAYKPRPLDAIPFMRGIPLETESLSTLMTNYDLRAHDDGRYQGLNHLTLCADENVQSLLADVVAASFATPDPFQKGPDPLVFEESQIPFEAGSGGGLTMEALPDAPAAEWMAPPITTIGPSRD